MYFLIEDNELLNKYNYILNKVSNHIKKEIDLEPIYNKILLETNIKSYGDEATDVHYQNMFKTGSNYTCLGIILIYFVLKKMKTIIHKFFLKECNRFKRRKSWLDILMMT